MFAAGHMLDVSVQIIVFFADGQTKHYVLCCTNHVLSPTHNSHTNRENGTPLHKRKKVITTTSTKKYIRDKPGLKIDNRTNINSNPLLIV